MSNRRIWLFVCSTNAWLLAAASPIAAQPVADFYRGRTINLLVGSGEGGGFDLSARLSAPFLSRHHSRQSDRCRAEHAGRIGSARRRIHLQRRAA